MILHMWKARSVVRRATDYIQHATTKVFPKIRAIEGHRGEYLLRARSKTARSRKSLDPAQIDGTD